MKFPGNYSECIEESGNFVVGVVTQVIVHGSSMGRTLRAHINSSLMIWISETVLFDKTQNILSLQLNTVFPLLEAAASNSFDGILAHVLLSKNWVLLRFLFKGGFYLRAASNKGSTVSYIFKIKLKVGKWQDVWNYLISNESCKKSFY